MACMALVVGDVRSKMKVFADDTSTYRAICDNHDRVHKDFPGIAPLMTNNQVSAHFGEVMCAEFGACHLGMTTFEAGTVQCKITIAAQQGGILPSGLVIRSNETLTSKRRADINGSSDDGATYELEAKAVSIQRNLAHRTVQLAIVNLKPDVPRLVITLFDWLSSNSVCCRARPL
ncbi:hypothetical protein T492DRAFT_943946 [Pavlovales sp. CCMP2436]|nr:hypothetical protein T492DRAFT_943946 [Pavlovales sp. CCMP2436]